MGDNYPIHMQCETDSESDYEEFTYTDLYTSDADPTKKNQEFKMTDSFQSADTDTSQSTLGSVLEVLQSREIDAKAFLKEIFGPNTKKCWRTFVPARFLIPSQCEGVSIEKFIEREIKFKHVRESTSSGFRGLLETAEARQHPALIKLVNLLCASMNMNDKLNLNNRTE